ncbi:hypothetical protein AB0I02_35535 [Streptomyces phaeochromogenes]
MEGKEHPGTDGEERRVRDRPYPALFAVSIKSVDPDVVRRPRRS